MADPFFPKIPSEREEALRFPDIRMPDPPAISAYNRIEKMIAEFEKKLDGDQEVGLCVVGAPGGGTVHITGLGYWGPDTIRFFGSMPDGSPIEIIQNVAQINVMLTAVQKIGDDAIRIANTDNED